MPALVRTDHSARITWLGRVKDRDDSLLADPVERIEAMFDGFAGECHGGATRPACSRFTMLHPKGTEIRNTRQISILSAEELAEIAAAIGLETLDPALLGASMVVEGIPDFSHVPPGARLQAPSGATLTVDLENGPCQFPAKEIERVHPGHGKGFKPAAESRRGVTAWVERPGALAVGDTLGLFVPTQPAWRGGS
ncbi:MOSC domain-containing protein [Psychromarinibacter sp. C21-152]|uniref:MOSC domain-containing protein n=1 Tax=Psychromarinibacter sediminicola TaxID=3033385 RepID=A0AAE3NQK7_9RHOB|nr:MOSC domain-containing protein [Psychromarinibacter sediminicola]MDF0599849.1 MOSC domain-containing protein [Psychromarinibacter sediminicola]